MLKISKRGEMIRPSATTVVSEKVYELRRRGVEVISLNIGEPDFNTPEYICRAAREAMADGLVRYTASAGIRPLLEAIARKLETENGITYAPEDICVMTGAKQAIQNAIFAIVDKGDEVIIPTPCWVSYETQIELAGGTPVLVETNPDFSLNVQAIREAVNENTRAVIINTPNNPTGAVYSEESLRQLAQLALEKDLYIITDEVYEKLVYDGQKHFSVASISPEVSERTVTINGFSKTYAMTGWRIGYAACTNKAVMRVIAALNSQMLTCTSAVGQYAALAALTGPQEDMLAMMEEYGKRKDYLVKALNEIPGITCDEAKGAFYLMPDVSGLEGKCWNGRQIENSTDAALFFLEEAQTAVVPGDAFHCPHHVRLAYANSMENLQLAVKKLAEAVSKLTS